MPRIESPIPVQRRQPMRSPKKNAAASADSGTWIWMMIDDVAASASATPLNRVA